MKSKIQFLKEELIVILAIAILVPIICIAMLHLSSNSNFGEGSAFWGSGNTAGNTAGNTVGNTVDDNTVDDNTVVDNVTIIPTIGNISGTLLSNEIKNGTTTLDEAGDYYEVEYYTKSQIEQEKAKIAKQLEGYTRLYINSELQLKALVAYINDENNCSGKEIILLNDITINDDTYKEDNTDYMCWEPIKKEFYGKFYGNHKTIKINNDELEAEMASFVTGTIFDLLPAGSFMDTIININGTTLDGSTPLGSILSTDDLYTTDEITFSENEDIDGINCTILLTKSTENEKTPIELLARDILKEDDKIIATIVLNSLADNLLKTYSFVYDIDANTRVTFDSGTEITEANKKYLPTLNMLGTAYKTNYTFEPILITSNSSGNVILQYELPIKRGMEDKNDYYYLNLAFSEGMGLTEKGSSVIEHELNGNIIVSVDRIDDKNVLLFDGTLPMFNTRVYIQKPSSDGIYTTGKEVVIEALSSEPLQKIDENLPEIYVTFSESGKGNYNGGEAKLKSYMLAPNGKSVLYYSYIIDEADDGYFGFDTSRWYMTDVAGNEHAPLQSLIELTDIYVDNTPPTLEGSLSIVSPTTGTYKSGQTVKFVATFSEDITGTAPTLNVLFDGYSGKNTASTGTISGNTITWTYVIRTGDNGSLNANISGGKITDLQGNEWVLTNPGISGQRITADTTAPTISVSGNPTTWTNEDVELTITCDDASAVITVNNTPITEKTYKVTAKGTYIFVATDEAGNTSTQTITVNKIDKTAPTISNVQASPTELTNGDVIVTVTATDNESGIKEYSFDGGNTWQTGNTKTYTENTENIKIQVKDSVGLVKEYDQEISISNIDKELPGITFNFNGENDVTGAKVGASEAVEVDIEISEDSEIAYKWDNENWLSVSGFIKENTVYNKFTEAGTHILYVKAVDKAGNESINQLTITVVKKLITGISVTKAPTTTSYIAGQNFNNAGMKVTATYNDGSTKEVTGYTVTDGNNLAAGKTSVTISYTEDGVTETTTQSITVVKKVITGISVTKAPTTTSYIAGQNFNNAGMKVTATYNDGSTKEVTGYTVTDGNNLAAGKTSVTISYTEDGETKTTTQAITVGETTVPEIIFKDLTTKQEDGTNYVNVTSGMTREEIIAKMDVEALKGETPEFNKLTSDNKIKTGSEISLGGEKKYVIVVNGDLNCDGQVTFADIIKTNAIRIIGGEGTLSKAQLIAVDINNTGKIEFKDIISINAIRINLSK